MRLPLCSSWASAAQAVISEITSPAPCVAATRRNGASVTPDMGARNTGFGSIIGPMETDFICALCHRFAPENNTQIIGQHLYGLQEREIVTPGERRDLVEVTYT